MGVRIAPGPGPQVQVKLRKVVFQPTEAKARAEELTGIPQGNMMMSCTHTHYGPVVAGRAMQPDEDGYLDWATERMGDAVKIACTECGGAMTMTGGRDIIITSTEVADHDKDTGEQGSTG